MFENSSRGGSITKANVILNLTISSKLLAEIKNILYL